MSDARHVLVTGSTGNVGREVVRALLARGTPLHAADSDPARVERLFGAGVPSVRLDFRDPATYDDAVRGARALFLLRPPPIADVERTLNVLVDRAASAGVEHVVFLSVVGADRQSWIPHYKVERHLERSRTGWTFLRCGFFAQNLGDAYREDLRTRGELYVPAGRGKVAFVDVRDVAEVAARACDEPSLRGRAPDLTGPEAVGFDEVAARLTRLLGRPIRYRAASVPGYVLRLRGRGITWGQALVQAALHVGIRFGNAAPVDPALGALLGRAPRSIDAYIADHRALWDPTPGGG